MDKTIEITVPAGMRVVVKTEETRGLEISLGAGLLIQRDDSTLHFGSYGQRSSQSASEPNEDPIIDEPRLHNTLEMGKVAPRTDSLPLTDELRAIRHLLEAINQREADRDRAAAGPLRRADFGQRFAADMDTVQVQPSGTSIGINAMNRMEQV